MNNQLIKMIKRHEGLNLMPYNDTVGELTIGYGHNLDANGITVDIAELLLEKDIEIAINELQKIFIVNHRPNKKFYLNRTRENVLINMSFNLGYNGLLGFKRMWEALKAGDFDKAAVEMLDSKWARQVGNRAIELAELMKKG